MKPEKVTSIKKLQRHPCGLICVFHESSTVSFPRLLVNIKIRAIVKLACYSYKKKGTVESPSVVV